MKILLADDHKLLRDGLRPLLGKVQTQVQVIEADDLPDAIAAVEAAGGVDLALLDLRMPGMNGLSGLTAFMGCFPNTRVVVLSAFGDSDTVLAAIRAGAAGFIPKTIGGRGFVSALRLIMSGEIYVPGNTLLEMDEQTRPMPEPSQEQPAPDKLEQGSAAANGDEFSDREREIMRLVVDGTPNKVIARQLGLQEPTVKACLRGLFRKIGAANRTQAVKIILGLDGRLL